MLRVINRAKSKLSAASAQVLEWINKDLGMSGAASDKIIAAGGCIASLISGSGPKDYDFFFVDRRSAGEFLEVVVGKVLDDSNLEARVVSDALRKRIMIKYNTLPTGAAVGEAYGYVDEDGYTAFFTLAADNIPNRPVGLLSISPTAVTIRLDDGKVAQIVYAHQVDAKSIGDTFDFLHTMGYYTPDNDELHISRKLLLSIAAKRLVYTGSQYPISSMQRMLKFVERGWRIDAVDMLAIALDIANLDLSDPYTLGDQVFGIDLMAFTEEQRALLADTHIASILKEAL